LIEIATPALPPERISEYDGERYLDAPDAFTNDDEPTCFEIDGHKLEVFWRQDDNYYVYARLTQPDGTVWHGWSGYGVGAGLEDCDYGYSTEDRECSLWSLFERPGARVVMGGTLRIEGCE
jgi:hypothetical protein